MVYNRPPYRDRRPQEPRHQRPEEPGRQAARRAARRPPRPAVADFRPAERDRHSRVTLENIATAGARADAGRRPARRRARLFVPALCRSQGSRRPGRRHRAAADGRTQAQALWRGDHREHQIRHRAAGRGHKFLRATIRGFRDVSRNPSSAVESVLRRDEHAKKDVELERLRMAIRDNVLTPEVRANGFGAIDPARMEEAIARSRSATRSRRGRRPRPCSIRRSCRRRRNGAPTRACTHKRSDRMSAFGGKADIAI